MYQSMQAPPPMPTSQYYVAVNGQQSGPYGVQQLQQFAAQGLFTAQSLVWKQGMAGWEQACNVAELAQLFMVATPPPMPGGGMPPMPPSL